MIRRLLALLALSTMACSTWQPGEKLAVAGILADAATTEIGLHNGGEEANPLFSWADRDAALSVLVVNVGLHFLIRHHLADRDVSAQKWNWRWIAGVRFGVAGWNAVQSSR